MDIPNSGFPPFVVTPDSALNPVSRDGSGVTVRAVDSRTQGPVYLRIFPAHELADSQRQQTFVQLARALIEADHACFTRITHTGCENAFFYYAMAAGDGELLVDRIRSRPLTAEASARVLTACLEALSVAERYPGLLPRIYPGNIHLVADPEDGPATVRLLLHNLIPARAPLEEPAYLPPESHLAEPPNTSGTLFSAGALLHTLLSGAAGPNVPALLAAARQMTAAPDHRPQTLDEARHLLRDALVKPAPATVAVTPEAPAQPQPSAPAAEDLGAIGRLTLELTRRAQAELHLTSKINGLESRLREREAAQNRLETEVDALRARLKASSESAAGGRNVDPGSGQTPEPQKTGVRDPHLTEPRKRYELAPPWVLWFALGTLAALMLAALYLLFQTLHDTQKLERERRRTARPEETARTASPAPTHHQYLSEVLTETELQSVP